MVVCHSAYVRRVGRGPPNGTGAPGAGPRQRGVQAGPRQRAARRRPRPSVALAGGGSAPQSSAPTGHARRSTRRAFVFAFPSRALYLCMIQVSGSRARGRGAQWPVPSALTRGHARGPRGGPVRHRDRLPGGVPAARWNRVGLRVSTQTRDIRQVSGSSFMKRPTQKSGSSLRHKKRRRRAAALAPPSEECGASWTLRSIASSIWSRETPTRSPRST